jgi:hypothetical protein
MFQHRYHPTTTSTPIFLERDADHLNFQGALLEFRQQRRIRGFSSTDVPVITESSLTVILVRGSYGSLSPPRAECGFNQTVRLLSLFKTYTHLLAVPQNGFVSSSQWGRQSSPPSKT